MTPHRNLVERAAHMFGVRVSDIFAPNRAEDAIRARFALVLALTRRGLGSRYIGSAICRDRSTVSNALRQAQRIAACESVFAARVEALATGNPLAQEVTWADVATRMRAIALVPLDSADGLSRWRPGETRALVAAVLAARDEGLTLHTVARALGRRRASLRSLAYDYRDDEHVATLHAAYARRYGLQAPVEGARVRESATLELAAA